MDKVYIDSSNNLNMEKKQEKKFILKAFVTIISIILFLNFLLLIFIPPEEIIQEISREKFISFNNSTSVTMSLPAVDADGNGVITSLKVEKTEGTGRTLTEIDNLLFWADTQHSIRIAKMVAGNITNHDLDEYDFVYTVKANASIIGGPSAGAALTIATIAAILEIPLDENVMITGSVNSDGSIGPVSEIISKAKAAKNAGAGIFLVPLLQNRDVIYETIQNCEEFGSTEICSTETRPKKVNISQEIGIQIKEVENINESINYFFN